MQYITTTQLRTRSKDLVETIKSGKSVDLIHRSEPIAEIRPKIRDPKPFDPEKFKKIVDKLNLPYLSDKEIKKRYRKAMMKKHGEGISRH